MKKKYIFRWKEIGDQRAIEVWPTRASTPEEAWEKAEDGVYPDHMTPEEGKEFVRKYGEVIEENA